METNRITSSPDQLLADRISSLFGTARVIVSGVFGQSRKKLVLIAERDKGTLNFIDRLLSKVNRHCEIVKVTDGADAFATICSRPPDLIIANPNLDGINGFRLVDNVRMDQQARKIPLIPTNRLTSSTLLTNLLANFRNGFSGAMG